MTETPTATFERDEVNRYCDLPDIEPGDAFNLYHASLELTRALATFRDMLPKLGGRQLERLVRALGRSQGVGGLAAAVLYLVHQRTTGGTGRFVWLRDRAKGL